MNLRKHAGYVRPLAVRFVQEEKRRDMLLLQGLKEGFGVGLNTLHCADYHHRRVQRPKRALHLGGEIHVAGGVDQVDERPPPVHADAGGLDRDAPPLFHGEIVGMGGTLVHAAGAADSAGVHQQLFGQGGFACVNVGEYADVADGHGVLHRMY